MIKKNFYYIFLFVLFFSCQLEGVEKDQENNTDTTIIENTIDSSDVEKVALGSDGVIDGETNDAGRYCQWNCQ